MTTKIIGVAATAALLLTSSFVSAMEMTATGTDTMMKKDGMMHKEGGMMENMGSMKKDTAMMHDSMMSMPGMSMEENFGLGAHGDGVSALQAVLESKGFLTLPQGVARGHFGPRTKSALMKYQRMIGVTATGFFGPLTRSKHMSMTGDTMMHKSDTMMKKDGTMMESSSTMMHN